MIFSVRVTTGQEGIVSGILAKKAKKENLPVYSVIYIGGIRGYLFIEAENEDSVAHLVQKIRHVKGFLRQPVSFEEIENLIKSEEKKGPEISLGDIIEIVSGPFKREKGKIIKVDDEKGQVTVELIDVAVPIPVTVKIKNIKMVERKS